MEWWLHSDNLMKQAPLHPADHQMVIFTDASNSGWGAHWDQKVVNGKWSLLESKLHINVLEMTGLKTFPTGLLAKDCVGVVRQHNSGGSHKQARGHVILGNVHTDVADYDVVHKVSGDPESPTHHGEVKRNCRQPLQDSSSPTDRVVSLSQDVQATVPKVAYTTYRLVRDSLEPQAPRIHVPSAGPTGLGCGRTIPIVAGAECIRVSANGNTTKGAPKSKTVSVSINPNRPRLAEDVVVLGPSGIISGSTDLPPTSREVVEATSPLRVPPGPEVPQSPCLAPRSTHLRHQGFAREVADRISAPQRPSTRVIYKSKWSVFERWCTEHALAIGSVSMKDITDFFMYLYTDLNRRPSTIEGYRTAIADTLGNDRINISHSEELNLVECCFTPVNEATVRTYV